MASQDGDDDDFWEDWEAALEDVDRLIARRQGDVSSQAEVREGEGGKGRGDEGGQQRTRAVHGHPRVDERNPMAEDPRLDPRRRDPRTGQGAGQPHFQGRVPSLAPDGFQGSRAAGGAGAPGGVDPEKERLKRLLQAREGEVSILRARLEAKEREK